MLQMVESAPVIINILNLKLLTLCGKKHSEGVFMMRKTVNIYFSGHLAVLCIIHLKYCSVDFPTGLCMCLVVSVLCFFIFRERAWDGRNLSGNRRFAVSVFVTAGEFITGIIVNKWLHYSVWDYSQMPLPGIWTDLCTFYDYFFRSKCTWNFSQWLSCILSLQRS